MFGKKVEQIVSREPMACAEDTAKSCDGCGCVVITARLQQVDDGCYWGRGQYNYCGRCKPPYDRVRITRGSTELHFYRRVPEHFVEVTEDGEEIINEKKED